MTQAAESLQAARGSGRRRHHLAADQRHLAGGMHQPARDLGALERPQQLEQRRQLEVADERRQLRVGLDADLAPQEQHENAAHQLAGRQAAGRQVGDLPRQVLPIFLALAEQQQRSPAAVAGLDAAARDWRAGAGIHEAQRRHDHRRPQLPDLLHEAPPLPLVDRRDDLVAQGGEAAGKLLAARGLRLDEEDGGTWHFAASIRLAAGFQATWSWNSAITGR